MLGRRMLRRAALGTAGVVALGLTGRHQAVSLSSTPSDAALGALWGEAIDGMIDVPGADELSHDGVLYLAPVGSAGTPPRPVKWPKLIGKSVVYSLTGWNPMGRDVSARARVRVRVRACARQVKASCASA